LGSRNFNVKGGLRSRPRQASAAGIPGPFSNLCRSGAEIPGNFNGDKAKELDYLSRTEWRFRGLGRPRRRNAAGGPDPAPIQRVRSGKAVVDLISESVIVELISWTVGSVDRRPKTNCS
jgi:hypothetical protein